MATTEDMNKWREWVDRVLENRRKLTKWEEDLLESISDQLDTRGSLSERQAEILERIYAEKT